MDLRIGYAIFFVTALTGLHLAGCSNVVSEQDHILHVRDSGTEPRILSVNVIPEVASQDTTVSVSVEAESAYDEPLSYIFSAQGTVTSTTSPNIVTWRPPSEQGTHTVTVCVRGGTGFSCATGTVLVPGPSIPEEPSGNASTSPNTAPVIHDVFFSTANANLNQEILVSVHASDAEHDILEYQFEAEGAIHTTGETSKVYWTPPPQTGSHHIRITVSDGTDSISCTRSVTVSDDRHETPGILQVSGTRIVDSNGIPVQLKGVGFYNAIYYHNDHPYLPTTADGDFWDHDETDFARIAGWGGNHVRFYMHEGWFREETASTAWRYIDRAVDLARRHDIYLILDMHFAQVTYRDWSASSQQKLTDTWAAIARRYKDCEVIAGYDLINEPSPDNEDAYWSLMQRITNTIRNTGDKHIVFVEAVCPYDFFRTRPFFTKLDDTHTVYSFHYYDHARFTHQGRGSYPAYIRHPYVHLISTKPLTSDPGQEMLNAATPEQWSPVSSGWITPHPDASLGVLEIALTSSAGSVWIDDLKLEQLNPDGTIEQVEVVNQTLAMTDRSGQNIGWFPRDTLTSGLQLHRDTSFGRTDRFSLRTANTNGIMQRARWSQQRSDALRYSDYFFKAQPQCRYRVSGWAYRSADFDGSGSFVISWNDAHYADYDKKLLQRYINQFVSWADQNNVPLYCGEFGAVPAAPGDDELRWLSDIREILNGDNLNGMNISWSYHNYRDYIGETDYSQRIEFGIIEAPRGQKPDPASLYQEIPDTLFVE